MRHDKARALVELARALAGSAEGLTLDEMAATARVDRRTAERMRDRLADLFPQLEAVADPPTKRFRIPAGLDGFLNAPTADEIAALEASALELQAQGALVRAAALRAVEAKVLAALRAPVRRCLAPDLEALLQAEAIAVQAGPRPFEDEAVLGVVREAIKAGRALSFRYAGGSAPGRLREVTPYGLLFGRSNYLVAAEASGAEAGPQAHPPAPRNWRLDRIQAPVLAGMGAAAPPGFSLQAYADQSFGIYQDDMEDVRASPPPPPPPPAAGASTSASGSRPWRTARWRWRSAPAACASWPGTCSAGAPTSRCWRRSACALSCWTSSTPRSRRTGGLRRATAARPLTLPSPQRGESENNQV